MLAESTRSRDRKRTRHRRGKRSARSRFLSDADREAKELKLHAIEESKQEVAKLVVLGMDKCSPRNNVCHLARTYARALYELVEQKSVKERKHF